MNLLNRLVGWQNGNALVLKTSGSNPLEVRVLYPPHFAKISAILVLSFYDLLKAQTEKRNQDCNTTTQGLGYYGRNLPRRD